MFELPIPPWILGLLSPLQSFLNRLVPEDWRPLSLWVLCAGLSAYIVTTDPADVFTWKVYPVILAMIYGATAGTYTLAKPAEKIQQGATDLALSTTPETALRATTAPAPAAKKVGKGLIGLIPVLGTAFLGGAPALIWTAAGGVIARLIPKKKEA